VYRIESQCYRSGRFDPTVGAFVDVLTGMSVEDFRTLRPSGDDLVTSEWVIEHLAQHEAEHHGQIWEGFAGEAVLGITRR
jgi:hypothetical protein